MPETIAETSTAPLIADWPAFAATYAQLSPYDQDRASEDLWAYGVAAVRIDDAGAHYVDVSAPTMPAFTHWLKASPPASPKPSP